MRIVIELRRDVNSNVILNNLYKLTPLQSSFGVNMIALVNGVPKLLNLKEVLYYYLEHQKEVVVRRTKFDLKKAQARAHILEGLRIALDNIDRIISLIRGSQTTEEAKTPSVSVEEAIAQCQQASGANQDRAVFDACMKDKGYQRSAAEGAAAAAASAPAAQ